MAICERVRTRWSATALTLAAMGVASGCTMPATGPGTPAFEPAADTPAASNPAAVVTPVPPGPSAWLDATGLWVRDAERPPRLLVADPNAWTGREPILSPDGRWVGYIAEVRDKQGTFQNELHVVSWVDGTVRQTVVGDALGVEDLSSSGQRRGILTPVWSPDSRMMAFDTISAADEAMPHSYDDLWTLDLDSGKVTRVLDEGKAGSVAFSPDGSMFAVATAGYFGADTKPVVKVLRTDGSGERELFRHPLVILHEEGYASDKLQWTLDGRSILLALPAPQAGEELLDIRWPTAQLYRLPLDGEPELLATVKDVVGGAYGIEWSPDAQHTAYVVTTADPSTATETGDVSYPPPAPVRDLIIAGPDGTRGQTVIRAPNLSFVGWMPDSQHFRYSRQTATELSAVTVGALP